MKRVFLTKKQHPKLIRLFTIIFLFFTSYCSLFAQQDIVVQIENIKHDKGSIYMGLFSPKDAWLDPEGTALGVVVPVVNGVASYVFKDVKAGEYAVSIFHDVNENAEMDFNFIGFPLEAFGFSNNPRILFSAPTFEECKFVIDGADLETSIRLKFFY